MTELALIAIVSIFTAGLTVAFGAIGPAFCLDCRGLS